MATDNPTSYRLLTAASLNRVIWRQFRIFFLGFLALAALGPGNFALFYWCSQRWPATVKQYEAILFGVMIAFALVGAALFLLAIWRSRSFVLSCPCCGVDVTKTKWVMQTMETRCCPNCWNRILEGGTLRNHDQYNQFCSDRNAMFVPIRIAVVVLFALLFLLTPYFREHAVMLVASGGIFAYQPVVQMIRTGECHDLVTIAGGFVWIVLGIWLTIVS